MEKYSSI